MWYQPVQYIRYPMSSNSVLINPIIAISIANKRQRIIIIIISVFGYAMNIIYGHIKQFAITLRGLNFYFHVLIEKNNADIFCSLIRLSITDYNQ